MDTSLILEKLIAFICLVPVISCHEFAHAWVADKCGDNTPRLQGRVTMNPLVHMDLMGTVILPLLCLFSFGGILGWGRPVYVNPSQFRNRRRDDTLVSLAGPGMNFLMAAIAMVVAKLGILLGVKALAGGALFLAFMSLTLAFFNLLPLPPLDGSHVVKNLLRMPEETYLRLSQYGLIFVFIAVQVPQVQHLLRFATDYTFAGMAAVLRI